MAHFLDAGEIEIGAVDENDVTVGGGDEQPLLRLGQKRAGEIILPGARTDAQNADCAGKQRENADRGEQRQKGKDLESGVVARDEGQPDRHNDKSHRQRQNKPDIAGGIGPVDGGPKTRLPARFGYPRHTLPPRAEIGARRLEKQRSSPSAHRALTGSQLAPAAR
jgi:hypothetical protein